MQLLRDEKNMPQSLDLIISFFIADKGGLASSTGIEQTDSE